MRQPSAIDVLASWSLAEVEPPFSWFVWGLSALGRANVLGE